MKIVYLPLDSRPCNMRFPVQLLSMAGLTCSIPDMDKMDHFRTPALYADTKDFLLKEAADADALILAVDHLAFGSLLASREDHVPVQEALNRLQIIPELKRINPSLDIMAYSIIMRASTSTLSADDVAWHHLVTAYSQASYKATIHPNAETIEEADSLAARIPARILKKYHDVRDRNHEVNKACIGFVRDGAVNRLLLLQEDAQPLGFHKLEQQKLLETIHAQGLAGRISLHNGADEGGCLCAARLAPKPMKLYVEPLGRSACDFVAKYEDRPFYENINSSCRFAGIDMVSLEEADKILCVLPPINEPQQDALYQNTQADNDQEANRALAGRVLDLMQYGKPVGLLDVCFANGGSIGFMNALSEKMDVMALSGYAAWNTASNSLGTLLAQLQLGNDSHANQRFTVERLLDDLLYQGHVRNQLQNELKSAGEDTYALADKECAERLLQIYMREAVQKSPVFKGHPIAAEYRLPWPRTFELDVTVTV
ncbi:MAG: DUF4127 family protein [Christensenellales bacterium]|jgi:hypothetical protein